MTGPAMFKVAPPVDASAPVSVIVPMRNVAATLAQTLDSLLVQTWPHFELIVSDNGSSDRSVAIAESYLGRFADMRVIDASVSPGSGFARRAGVEVARGELLIFIDSDDVVSENYVEAMSAALRTRTFVHAAQDMSLLNPPWVSRIQPGRGSRTEMVGDWKFAGSATLGVRRAVYDEVGGFCTEPEIAEDNDFCFRTPSFRKGSRNGSSLGRISPMAGRNLRLVTTSLMFAQVRAPTRPNSRIQGYRSSRLRSPRSRRGLNNRRPRPTIVHSDSTGRPNGRQSRLVWPWQRP